MIRYVHLNIYWQCSDFILTCTDISKETKDQSVIIRAVAGVGSAIAILLIISVIVFMIKRRRDGSPGTIYFYPQICTYVSYRVMFALFLLSLYM
jgi:hypothetical protein